MTIKVKIDKAPSPEEIRKRELFCFLSEAGLEFGRLDLLDNAFTHSSYANEKHQHDVVDNERLEFVGDGILDMVVAMWLYDNVNMSEGYMTKIRSTVVCESALAKMARKLNLGKYIRLGKGEEATGGRDKDAVLADCMEAVIAAIYMDQGFEAASSFVLTNLMPYLPEAVNQVGGKDYKTLLQEYCQKKFKTVPTYTQTGVFGPNHDQTFYYVVEANGMKFGPASGHSKKAAEQEVAKLAYEQIKES